MAPSAAGYGGHVDWILGSWRSAGYVALSAVLIYLSAVVALRTGERRTLAELTIFDFTVAVALGTIIGRTATTESPSYVQGVVAVVALLATHRFVAWGRLHSQLVHRIVDRRPRVLVRDGIVDVETTRRALVSDDDLQTVLRQHGLVDLSAVRLVVLEPRGAFSVIVEPVRTGLTEAPPD